MGPKQNGTSRLYTAASRARVHWAVTTRVRNNPRLARRRRSSCAEPPPVSPAVSPSRIAARRRTASRRRESLRSRRAYEVSGSGAKVEEICAPGPKREGDLHPASPEEGKGGPKGGTLESVLLGSDHNARTRISAQQGNH